MEINTEVPKKLKIEFSYDPVIPLLVSESKSAYYRDPRTPIFIVALVTITKLWKQPRCLSMDEWIKKIWHIYTMDFYSTIKKNEIMSSAGKWMELETIMLCKISQSHKEKYLKFSFTCRI
jgi:hypothetical protein